MARISKQARERMPTKVPWNKLRRADEIVLMDEEGSSKLADGDLIVRIITDFTVTNQAGDRVPLKPDSNFGELVMWGTFASCSGPARHLYMAGYWDVPFRGGGYETGIIDDIALVYMDKDKIFRDGLTQVLWLQTTKFLYILTDPHDGYLTKWRSSIKAWIKDYDVDPTVHDIDLGGPRPSWCHLGVWNALLKWAKEGDGSSGSDGVESIDKGPLDLNGVDCRVVLCQEESEGEEGEAGEEVEEVEEIEEIEEVEGEEEVKVKGKGRGKGAEEEDDDDSSYEDDREQDEDDEDDDDDEDEDGGERESGDEREVEGQGEGEDKGEGGVEGDGGLKRKRKVEDLDEDENGDENGGEVSRQDDARARKRAKSPGPPPRSPTLDDTPRTVDRDAEPTPRETPNRAEADAGLDSAQQQLSEVSISGKHDVADPVPTSAAGRQANSRFDPVRDVQAAPEPTVSEAAALAPNNNPEDLGVAPRRARR
ncbi:hypothetical protein FRC06_002845 [Ceratobasidium sp. 370]|nr:hypothetical protein FRC06_002845 [Ceratobasidium sp. 370]